MNGVPCPKSGGWLLLAAASAFLTGPQSTGAGELRGRVLAEGRAVARATVAVVPFETAADVARREARDLPSPPALLRTETRADGTFVLGLPADAPAVQVRVEFPGFLSVRKGDAYDGSATVDLGDVALSRAAALTGRVVDGRGAPVPDAAVQLEPGLRGDNESAAETRLSRTGPDGSFRFDGASPSGNRLRVGKGAYASVALGGLRAGALASPMVLGPAAVRTGAIRRVDGRTPAAGVLVRFEGKAVTRWVETGADGSFRITDAPAAPGRVVAEGGPLGRGEARVAAASASPLVIVLDPPTRIAGRVVNAKTLQPVPRVRIEAQAQGRTAVARSGPDGRYVLDALAPGTYRISADEPRFARYVRQGVRLRIGQTRAVDLPLTLGATLAGRAVDEEGRPVAGAVGRLSRIQRGGGGFGGRFRGPRDGDAVAFRTSADGTFRAERLPPGTGQRLTLAHPQFEPGIVGGLSLTPGGVRSGLTVVLRRGLEITGFVRDSEGRPVEGAEVALAPSASERRGGGGGRFAFDRAAFDPERTRTSSGPDGRYRVAGLEPGAYSLGARKDGYAEGRIELLRVDTGQTPAVDVWLLPGAAISGFVRQPDGSGAKGFIVRAVGAGDAPRPPAPGPQEATGDDGAFAIEGLRPGETYTLAALGRGGMQQQEGITAPNKDVEILVGGVGGISGRVVDAPAGKPVTDFTATYEPDGGAGPGRRMRGGAPPRGPRRSPTGDDDEDAFHSSDGTFLIENVPAGTWAVNVEADGYESARLSGVNVREGETTAEVEVRITRGRVLSGRATDSATGRPVPGVSITATSATGGGPGGVPGMMAASDADGRFELAGLGVGTYQLLAQHPDYAEASQIVDMQQAAGSTEIRLSAGGTLAGIVVSESGGAVPGANVALQSGGGGGPRMGGGGPGGQPMVTDQAGSFRFDRLAAGRYTVAASAGNQSSAPVDVALMPGQSREDLRIALGAGTTLRGQVSGLGNDLRGSVNVNATGPDGYFAGVRPTVDGSFSARPANRPTVLPSRVSLTSSPPRSGPIRSSSGCAG